MAKDGTNIHKRIIHMHIPNIHTHYVENGEKRAQKEKWMKIPLRIWHISWEITDVFWVILKRLSNYHPNWKDAPFHSPSRLLTVSQPNERRRRTTIFHMEPLKKHQMLVKTEEGKTTNKWVSECDVIGIHIFIHIMKWD